MSISLVIGETGKRAGVAPLGVSVRQRFPVLPRPNLEWTPEVERATAHLYEKVEASSRRSNGRSTRLTSRRSTS